jgi:hypothetical protein
MFSKQHHDSFNHPAFHTPQPWQEEQLEGTKPPSTKFHRLQTSKTVVTMLVWFALALNVSLWSRDSDNRIWAWLVLGGLRASNVIALFSQQTGDAKAAQSAIAGSIATLAGMIGGGAY